MVHQAVTPERFCQIVDQVKGYSEPSLRFCECRNFQGAEKVRLVNYIRGSATQQRLAHFATMVD